MLYKNKFALLFCLLIVALCFSFTNASKKKLTPEQQALKNKMKAERMKKSEAADKLIRHVKAKDFKKVVLNDNENLWIVFYGSKKCPHTQKFNPKWLQFQKNMDDGLYNFENIKIGKIECYGEQFDFCVSQKNQYWPELMFYFKGEKKGTYDGEDEIEDIVKYIKSKKKSLMKVKSTKTVIQSKNSLPTNKPSKQSPPRPTKGVPPKAPAKRPPKQAPSKQVPQTKALKGVPEVIKNKDNSINDNFIDEEIDNSIDDKNNEVENAIEDDFISQPKKNVNIEDNLSVEEGSSHVLLYSIGGCAACVAGLLFAKKRFRGHGYTSFFGNYPIRYKYYKNIV